MHRRTTITLIAALLGTLCSGALAAEYQVKQDGTGDFTVIQEAIDAARTGDKIIVYPGTYYENIHFDGKNIVLRSTDPQDQDVVEATVIDGSQKGSVVTFDSTEDDTCELSGFTIQNGEAQDGGGISGADPSDPYTGTMANILSCVIQDNAASNNEGRGGGVFGCSGLIEGCVISRNTAGTGGGLCYCGGTISKCRITHNSANSVGGVYGMYYFEAIIKDCEISYNFSYGAGGGLGYTEEGQMVRCKVVGNVAQWGDGGGLYRASAAITDCVISGNVSGWHGGGLSFSGGPITNTLIADNVAAGEGGGLSFCGGPFVNVTIANNFSEIAGGGLSLCLDDAYNCIIWGNSAGQFAQMTEETIPSFCCIQDYDGEGEGVITEDPLFVCPEIGNYRLHPASPCIDSGDNSMSSSQTDLDGNPRVFNGTIDMGAYEFQGAGCFLKIGADRELYTGGDTLRLRLSVNNLDPGQMVDVYAAMLWPDGGLLYIPSLSSEPTPLVSGFDLPQGAAFGPVEVFSYPFTEQDPDGSYMAYSVLTPSGTGDITDWASNLAACSFRYRRFYKSEWHVNQDGSGDFITIQSAIDSAEEGDTIIVHQGIYEESVQFKGKSVILRSVDPEDHEIVQNTVIDGGGRGWVVRFNGNEEKSCELSGFTIRNAGGFYLVEDTAGVLGQTFMTAAVPGPTISRCIVSGNAGCGIAHCSGTIVNCTITANDVGIYACCANITDCLIVENGRAGLSGDWYYGCYGTLSNCEIRGNKRGEGWLYQADGGIEDFTGVIENCTIVGNTADNDGGGLEGCIGEITNCVISENVAAWSGGGLCSCSASIIGCTVEGNLAGGYGGGFCGCGGRIANCVVEENVAANWGGGFYSCNGEVENCLIVGNSARNGGGLSGCSWVVRGCTIVENSATQSGGGLCRCYGKMSDCIVWGNHAPQGEETYQGATPRFCCIRDWTGGGQGNITEDPMFAPGPFGEYYLSHLDAGQGRTSPCVDAGSTSAQSAGMAGFTTRTDQVPDTGPLDIGYHYPIVLE